MAYAFAPPPITVLTVAGEDISVPVRRVHCVGRNYAAHAREMGHDPDREPPFFFAKPTDAVVAGGTIPYPRATTDVHHEIELVVIIGEGGRNISVDNALNHVYGYAVGIDFTRRDIQAEAKKAGRPWAMAKGFDQSGPVSDVKLAAKIGHPDSGLIWLKINGETRQSGDLKQQIWNVQETISYLSSLVDLAPGDLIFTGTPDGVGPVNRGDKIEGHIDGIGDLVVTIE